jgi:DNA (cytosine-5)-methyltransferase 1
MIGRNDNAGPQGDGINEEVCFTQNIIDRHAVAQPIAFEPGKLKRLGYGDAEPGLSPALRAQAGDNQLAVAFNIAPSKGALKDDIHVTDAHVSKTIDASGSNPAMHQGGAAIVQPIGVDMFNAAFSGEVAVPLTNRSDGTGTGPTVMTPVSFQETADCLTAAYGTKWNGNASATNGSLFAAQPIGWSEELTASIDLASTIQRGGDGGRHDGVMQTNMAVRRLTPVECERLQGFPDNYTEIPWRKKPADQCPDGPRYKALGNSWAVPVVHWIGKRIQAQLEK